jgi:hypothetical protein
MAQPFVNSLLQAAAAAAAAASLTLLCACSSADRSPSVSRRSRSAELATWRSAAQRAGPLGVSWAGCQLGGSLGCQLGGALCCVGRVHDVGSGTDASSCSPRCTASSVRLRCRMAS